MEGFSELLARKTQIKNCLTSSTAKTLRESMEEELERVNQEIQQWLQANPAF